MEIPVVSISDIPCDVPIDNVVCSTAIRCRQTLDGFLHCNQVNQVIYSPDFTERNMGIMEGQYREKMVVQYPDLFQNNRFRVFETPPNGEPFEDLRARATKCWDMCCHEFNGTLLICSHNQFLKMMYFIICNIPVTEEAWNNLNFACGVVKMINEVVTKT